MNNMVRRRIGDTASGRVFELLAMNIGTVVPRRMIGTVIWPDAPHLASDNLINTHVCRARARLPAGYEIRMIRCQGFVMLGRSILVRMVCVNCNAELGVLEASRNYYGSTVKLMGHEGCPGAV